MKAPWFLPVFLLLVALAACAPRPTAATQTPSIPLTPTDTAASSLAPETESSDLPQPGQSPAAPEEAAPEMTTLLPGWTQYCSAHYGYCFQYPANAAMAESGVQSVPTDEIPAGMTPDAYAAQLEAAYGRDLCVQLRTPTAYLYISSPANAGFKYAGCGRTGVGDGEMTARTEAVTILGQVYEATGYTLDYGGATTELFNETMVFTLEDGTRIEYGSLPSAAVSFAEYEQNGRPLIHRILETFIRVQ